MAALYDALPPPPSALPATAAAAGSSPLPPMSAAARRTIQLGQKDCLCGGPPVQQLMIYDDPSMTQLGPGGSTVLPPAMPLHHLGPLGEGTTMTTRAPLPAEEIRIYLEHKLRELERTDSALSGRTRDSGFNSEHPSLFPLSEADDASAASAAAAGGDNSHCTGSDIPSAIFGDAELPSCFLENYGLDGPLEDPKSQPPPQNELAATGISSSQLIEALMAVPQNASGMAMSSGGGSLSWQQVSRGLSRRKSKARSRRDEEKQATIRQHYYPEGGWGFVIVAVTFLVQVITHGFQMSLGILLLAVLRRWGEDTMAESVWLCSLCTCVSLLASPVTVAVCRRKSTRLTAVIGGLVAALGCLFSSFASQHHQLFLSMGLMLGIGVGMTRDAATLMVAQYFKRRREVVEVAHVAASGAGIAAMSAFVREVSLSLGWRLGLQSVTGVLAATFFLGTFYRSASLYHPQRRAILHLKQTRKKVKSNFKDKERAAAAAAQAAASAFPEEPFFEFTVLKSRTVQIMLFSTALAYAGINAPLFLLPQLAISEGVSSSDMLSLQLYLGVAFCVGSAAVGAVVINNSTECRIARQYLCQASLAVCALSIYALAAISEYNGYHIFVWIYGVSHGGYVYAFKMYIFEKVRARNFARAWGFAQMAMGIPTLVGIPAAMYLNSAFRPSSGSSEASPAEGGTATAVVVPSSGSSKPGFYLSATLVLLGALSMSLIDLHKGRLRRRKKRALVHTRSIQSTATFASSSYCPTHSSRGGSFYITTPRYNGYSHATASHSNGNGAATPIILLAPSASVNGNEFNSEGGRSVLSVAAAALDSRRPSASMVGAGKRLSLADCREDVEAAAGVSPTVAASAAGILPQDMADRLAMFAAATTSEVGGTVSEVDDRQLIEMEPLDEEDEEEEEHLYYDGDMDYLENITSCDKVENCVVLSEFEANLSKAEDGGDGGAASTGEVCSECHGEVVRPQESRRGSAISLLFSGRKKKWPSLFGGKKRGRPDGDSYASEAYSDVRMKDLEQSQSDVPKCEESTAEGEDGAPEAKQNEKKSASEHDNDDDDQEQ